MKNKTNNVQQNQYKLVIYTRNTSWEQPIGRRLHRNIQILKDKYERLGYKISKVYSEPSPNFNKKERPVLRQLLKDAASGLFEVVLVWDVFTLTDNGAELQQIERELTSYDVELCSATEQFDTSTSEGQLHFQQMMSLLEYEHLACKRDISLSSLARLIMTKGECMKGVEWNAESSLESNRTA
ncbi:recombinase family protein [Virgibacillus salarius]|uniref:recombinase family protein n=1 Tax=Virgibacillus salarius TaxID=447199 RepID=UPI002490E766|nr:recombinase family protein [Virgibacillus salarius]WBX81516.1 recombinase family protein [Virgibacillus salarius]